MCIISFYFSKKFVNLKQNLEENSIVLMLGFVWDIRKSCNTNFCQERFLIVFVEEKYQIIRTRNDDIPIIFAYI